MQEKKKNPDQGKVGEMGKPSLQSKFEASMQEQRDAMMGKAKKSSKSPMSKAEFKRAIEVARKRFAQQTEMGGKDNSEKFEGAMQKAFMSRFKN
jgi:hypothetical protein